MFLEHSMRYPLSVDPSIPAIEVFLTKDGCPDNLLGRVVFPRLELPPDFEITPTSLDCHFFGSAEDLRKCQLLFSYDCFGRINRLWRFEEEYGWHGIEIQDESKGKCELRPFARLLFTNMGAAQSFSRLCDQFLQAKAGGNHELIGDLVVKIIELMYCYGTGKTPTGYVTEALANPYED